ncbi:MAG: DUF1697 domain-containing protein [Gammaproteobacteria bacterium]|nr:MAG: DUF1697 domain-containing protein [Gammaproteobacteria bacterium]
MLRGINISGQKKILMKDLKALYESMGFSNVVTYIQSGNVIFKTDASNVRQLVENIESNIMTEFGFDVPVIIRRPISIQGILRNNPFLESKKVDISKLHVTFLSDTVGPAVSNDLGKINSGKDEFVIKGKEIYLHCPGGYGKTKLNNNVIEKRLGVSATTRNWKTLNKLSEMTVADT